MNSIFDLSDQVAAVIGATGVLGGALADGLAAAGARIAVLGRNAARGEARVEAIRSAGGTAEFFAADAQDKVIHGTATPGQFATEDNGHATNGNGSGNGEGEPEFLPYKRNEKMARPNFS